MVYHKSKAASAGLITAAMITVTVGSRAWAGAHGQQSTYAALFAQANPERTIDLAKTGRMKDVLSNTPERDLTYFLSGAGGRYANGPVTAEAAKFKRVSRKPAGGSERAAPKGNDQQKDTGAPVSTFAKNVTLHVVLHEIGHALIREFDIPILANEETTADAFATYYLTTYMPDRALDALTARVTSLTIEAGEAKEIDWSGEHDADARRAYQIAALAVAADPVKYKPVAAIVKMSDANIKKAADYGGEVRRAWRRVLAPLWMPTGTTSSEARVVYDPKNEFLNQLCGPAGGGLASDFEAVLKRFDWHSQVTVSFVDSDGKAGWNRSSRTVTVHSQYVRRFIEQGRRGLPGLSK